MPGRDWHPPREGAGPRLYLDPEGRLIDRAVAAVPGAQALAVWCEIGRALTEVHALISPEVIPIRRLLREAAGWLRAPGQS